MFNTFFQILSHIQDSGLNMTHQAIFDLSAQKLVRHVWVWFSLSTYFTKVVDYKFSKKKIIAKISILIEQAPTLHFLSVKFFFGHPVCTKTTVKDKPLLPWLSDFRLSVGSSNAKPFFLDGSRTRKFEKCVFVPIPIKCSAAGKKTQLWRSLSITQKGFLYLIPTWGECQCERVFF